MALNQGYKPFFGSSNVFGGQQPAQGGSGFGSTAPVFGQPAGGGVGGGGGLFGGGSSGGGGGFGSTPTGGGLFGNAQSQPSTGFGASSQGAFGGTGVGGGSIFGGGSTTIGGGGGFGGGMTQAGGMGTMNRTGGLQGGAFGTSTTAPAFGQPSGGFGSNTGVFGQSQSAFGQSTSAFGSSPFGGGGGAKGTAGTKYQVTTEFDAKEGTSLKYQSISLMPAYKGKSVEELRVEDYLQGNKRGPASGAAGQASVGGALGTGGGLFGSSTPQQGGGLFGNTGQASSASLSWNAQAPATQNAFGSQSASAFGQTSTGLFGGGGMGASAPNTGGGLFGKTSAPSFSTPSTTGGSLLGGGGTTSTFGQTTPAASTLGGGGGLFGGTQQSASPFSFMGGASTTPGGGGFGGGGGLGGQQSSLNPLGGGSSFAPAATGGGLGNSAGAQQAAAKPFSTPSFASKPGQFGSGLGTGGLFSSQTTPAAGATTMPGLGLGGTPNTGLGGTSLFGPSATAQQPLQASATASPYGNAPLFASPPAVSPAQPLMGQAGTTTTLAGSQDAATAKAQFAATPPPSVFRRTPRSSAKVRPRSYMPKMGVLGSGSSVSSLFGSSSAGPTFSANDFLAGSDGTPWKSPEKSDVDRAAGLKKLVIEPVGETPTKPVSRTLALGDPKQQDETTPSKKSPASSGTRANGGTTPNGSGRRSGDDRPSKTPSSENQVNGLSYNAPLKPTPVKAAVTKRSLYTPKSNEQKRSTHAPNGRDNELETENGSSIARLPVDSDVLDTELDHTTGINGKDGANVEAPRLTRSGYYTKPSIDTLRWMTTDELRAVEDFTVGRTNVGEVLWPGLTDVHGIDLDKVVQLEPREVIVYPDEDDKPEVGFELNKEAESFAKRLQSHCEKEQLTFLGYEASTGTWSFVAQHFSRYGCTEMDL